MIDRVGQAWEVGGQIYLVHESRDPEPGLDITLHEVACINDSCNPTSTLAESAGNLWESLPLTFTRIL